MVMKFTDLVFFSQNLPKEKTPEIAEANKEMYAALLKSVLATKKGSRVHNACTSSMSEHDKVNAVRTILKPRGVEDSYVSDRISEYQGKKICLLEMCFDLITA